MTVEEKHITGWFNFDSLYQMKNNDGYVYLGDMVVINLNQIQSGRKRFQVFMEEYIVNHSSQFYDMILIEGISRVLDKSLKREQK